MVSKEQFLDHFSGTGGIIEDTITALGMKLKTLNEWIREDPDFKKKLYNMQREQVRLVTEDRLARKIIVEQDGKAMQLFLQSRVEEYAPKKQEQQTINLNFLSILDNRLKNGINQSTENTDKLDSSLH